MWPEAKKTYSELINDYSNAKELVWLSRAADLEGAIRINTDFQYLFGPETLKQYRIVEGMRVWLAPQVRMTFNAFEEIHRKGRRDGTPPIKKFIPGYKFKWEGFLNGVATFAADWQVDYHDFDTTNELGCEVRIDKPNFRCVTGYKYNHLIRDPIEGLNKEGRLNRFYAAGEKVLFERLIFGDDLWLESYSVRPEENTITGEGYLGYKIINEVYANVIVLKKPYVTFNSRCRYGKWNKSFPRANEVLDFVGDEKVYMFGFYGEDKIGSLARVYGGFTRTYDSKRKFYSSYTNFAIDMWFLKNMTATLAYEYAMNVDGVYGAGDVTLFTAKVEVTF